MFGAAIGLTFGIKKSCLPRRKVARVERRVRYLRGWLQGVSYRLRGGRPENNVSDLVLTDRIKSSLGPLEKHLDLPRIHVMVEDHVVLLHGEVGSDEEGREIETTVTAVPGVRGIESYLHVGLISGDTRPSAGRSVNQPSAAYQRLLEAVNGHDMESQIAPMTMRAILATLAERMPDEERNKVADHLPADVRAMFVPPRRSAQRRGGSASEFAEQVALSTPGLSTERAHEVTAAVVAVLRRLVPEAVGDIDAVLPSDLLEH